MKSHLEDELKQIRRRRNSTRNKKHSNTVPYILAYGVAILATILTALAIANAIYHIYYR